MIRPRRAANEWNLSLSDNGDDDRPVFNIIVGEQSYSDRGSAPLRIGTWQHLAGVRGGGQMRLHVDGRQVGQIGIGTVAVNNSGRSLRLVRTEMGAGDDYKRVASTNTAADYADVRIYSRALSVAEVAALVSP